MIWLVGRTLTVLTALHKSNVYQETVGVGTTAKTNGEFFSHIAPTRLFDLNFIASSAKSMPISKSS